MYNENVILDEFAPQTQEEAILQQHPDINKAMKQLTEKLAVVI
jgi:hypothetical protein